MSDNPTFQNILDTQEHFGLPHLALVEKDFYVVKTLAAIVAANTSPFRLVFSGGTALCRAHRLIERMSEDIDLKIISDTNPTRTELRHLRNTVSVVLQTVHPAFDPENPEHKRSRNVNRNTVYRLPYTPMTPTVAVLRSVIQIETVASSLLLPSVHLPVISFVAEAFGHPAEIAEIECVSITQTAAEKFVAFTRRTAAELANTGGKQDATLVRHLYDLHVMQEHYDFREAAQLVQGIMATDAEAFGNKFPAYRENQLTQTRLALAALKEHACYKQRYEQFLSIMVYGQKPTYEEAITTLLALAEHI